MPYLGTPPQSGFITSDAEKITGQTTNYVNLSNAISSLDDVQVHVNYVIQDPSTLTFTSTTRIGLGDTLVSSDVVLITYLGKSVATQSPPVGGVSNDMLAGSIANSKLATDPLNASNLASGTVPTARLGSGTASSSTFLRGDGSWQSAGGSNAPYFYAFRSGNQTSVSANTWTTVIHNSEVVDSENSYNTSTGQWTPSVAGYYQINAMVTAIPDANVSQLMIGIKSSSHGDPRYANFLKLGSTNINRFSGAVSGILYSSGSHTIETRIYIVGQGGSVHGEYQYTSFSGFRIIT